MADLGRISGPVPQRAWLPKPQPGEARLLELAWLVPKALVSPEYFAGPGESSPAPVVTGARVLLPKVARGADDLRESACVPTPDCITYDAGPG